MATSQGKAKFVPATQEDFDSLNELRNTLDQQSEEALAGNRPYIAGILTEMLVFVDDKLNRASRFSRRLNNADKRARVRAQRKALREAAGAPQTGANRSQASA